MLDLIRSALAQRSLIIQLTRRDMSSSYSGSVVGNAWIIVDPVIYVVLTLVFFQFAIKGGDTGGVPYVAWVLPQIIVWTFISTVVNSSVNAVKEYSFLLRHKTFDMRLTTVIKILSGTLVHVLLMVVVLMALVAFLGVRIGFQTLGLFYYFLSMVALLLALGWLLSSLGVFWKDMRNIVGIFLQVQFWVSPIFWEPERFPKPVAFVMYLNPFYYPIHGYRQSILLSDFGPHFWIASIYFWALVLVLLWAASKVFFRLSRSFGDAV